MPLVTLETRAASDDDERRRARSEEELDVEGAEALRREQQPATEAERMAATADIADLFRGRESERTEGEMGEGKKEIGTD